MGQKYSLSLADPGFGQGGPRNLFRDFANVAKWSWVREVSNIILAGVQGPP